MSENLEDERCTTIPVDEQETTINFSRRSEQAEIWTSDTTLMTKLDRMCKEAPENYQCVKVGRVKGNPVDKEYIIQDKTLISFRSRKMNRVLSEERRQEMSDNMKLLKAQGKL